MPEEDLNPYIILQLPESATYEQIKQRYRHLSKMVHPDKQPLQNYQMAQANFKKIDQAYKAISSELRRYIYRNYGPTGILVMENAPFYFNEFEDADLKDQKVINKLQQLMKYFMYQEHAVSEIDKNKLNTRTFCIIDKLSIKKISRYPRVQRSQYEFQTSLPDCLGFSHSFKIAHTGQNLSRTPKSDLSFGLGSSKRFQDVWMLNINTGIQKDKYNCEASIDRIINPNLVLHFAPLSFDESGVGYPQFGADAQFANFFVSGMTDFASHTLQISTSPANKNVSKMLKLSVADQAFVAAPMYEKQISQYFRIFIQFQIRTQIMGSQSYEISGGLRYGYKIQLAEQLKLELMSYLSLSENYFQVSFITPKFRTNIPIFCKAQMLDYQLFKIGVFVGVYYLWKVYNILKIKDRKTRKRLHNQNYNRLTVQRNAMLKINNENMALSNEISESQKKFGGLVICAAYIGSKFKLNIIEKKLHTIMQQFQKKVLYSYTEEFDNKIKELKDTIATSVDDFDQELYEITPALQAKVQGGQLLKFDAEQFGINPCLQEQSRYNILVFYWLNGKMEITKKNKGQIISINPLKRHYKKNFFQQCKDKIIRMIIC